MNPSARSLLSPLGLLATTLLTGGLVAAGCIIDWADDCGHNRDALNCKGGLVGITGGGGTGAGTGSSSSGSLDGGDGGDGGPMGCTDAGSCPQTPPPGRCPMVATCTNDVCGFAFVAGPALSQVYGNCKKNMCDATGAMVIPPANDDTNVFDNGNPCDNFSCNSGVLSSNPAAGMPCSTWMGTMAGFCEKNPDPDGNGDLVCSECVATPCTGVPSAPLCVSGTCVPTACNDGSMDNNETDIDCGNTAVSGCLACSDGLKCVKNADCFSKYCSGTPRVCQVPTCADNTTNGQETDTDCGGKMCPKCLPTFLCLQPSDCTTGVCKPTTPGQPATCQPASCTDGVKNGGETGIDCGGDGDGGPICPPCGDGGP